MARSAQSKEKVPRGHRDRLLPVLARAFAELGYRRATTAELARRCRVRENVLYRVWPSKKEMFLAVIDYVWRLSLDIWQGVLAKGDRNQSAAERILEYEAVHHGESGLYRIIFAGLSETEDPEICEALREMYLRFHRFIVEQIGRDGAAPTTQVTAWAFVGLATIANISRELGLMTEANRKGLFQQAGGRLLRETRG